MERVGTIKPKIKKWLEFSHLVLEYEFEVIKFNGIKVLTCTLYTDFFHFKRQ